MCNFRILFALSFALNTAATDLALENKLKSDNVERAFDNFIIQIERFSDKEQSLQWLKLQNRLSKEIYKDYVFQVHYFYTNTRRTVTIDTVDIDEAPAYYFKNFVGMDNNNIIPITVFLPKSALEQGVKVPVAFYTHGGPSSVVYPAGHNEIFPLLAGNGYAIVAPNYRGSSLTKKYEEQIENNFPEYILEDIDTVLQWISQQDYFDSNKILLTGISFGSYINLLSLPSTSTHFIGAALLKTKFEAEKRFGKGKTETSLSVFTRLGEISPQLPIFVGHGVRDEENSINAALNFATNARKHFINFAEHYVKHGNHHLVGVTNSEIGPCELAGDVEQNFKALKQIVRHLEKGINKDELYTYLATLNDFFYSVLRPRARDCAHWPVIPAAETTEEEILAHKIFCRTVINKANIANQVKMPRIPPNFASHLTSAPYSQTEAHLKLILGHEYVEGDLEKNVDLFFEYYEKNKLVIMKNHYRFLEESLQTEFEELEQINPSDDLLQIARKHRLSVKEVLAPIIASSKRRLALNADILSNEILLVHQNYNNPLLKNLVLQIIAKEKENPGAIVMYSGITKKVGMIVDLYTEAEKLLSMNPEKNATHMRMLENAFLSIISLQSLLKVTDQLSSANPQGAYNYLGDFQKVALSAQYSVFGGFRYWGVSSLLRYFYNDKGGKEFSIEELLLRFFAMLGMRFPEGAEEHIRLYYQPIFEKYLASNRGRFLQFFVDAKSINRFAYNSEVYGFPLDLKFSPDDAESHEPLPLLTRLRFDPLYCETKLKQNRHQFKHQTNAERRDIYADHNKFIVYDMVESRAFLDRDILNDVVVNDYSLNEISPEYKTVLAKQLYADMALWFEQSPTLPDTLMLEQAPLCKLFDCAMYGEYGVHPQRKESAAETDYETMRLRNEINAEPSIFDALLRNLFRVADRILLDKNSKGEKVSVNHYGLLAIIFAKNSNALQWLINNAIINTDDIYEVVAKLAPSQDWQSLGWFFSFCSLNQRFLDGDTILTRSLKEKNYVCAAALIVLGAPIDEDVDRLGQTARALIENCENEQFKQWYNNFVNRP